VRRGGTENSLRFNEIKDHKNVLNNKKMRGHHIFFLRAVIREEEE